MNLLEPAGLLLLSPAALLKTIDSRLMETLLYSSPLATRIYAALSLIAILPVKEISNGTFDWHEC